jgi:hypothetical protein
MRTTGTSAWLFVLVMVASACSGGGNPGGDANAHDGSADAASDVAMDGVAHDAVMADTGGGDGSGGMCTADHDCDDGMYCNGVETCHPGMAGADARGCVAGMAPCDAGMCMEATQSCAMACPDRDHDGHTDAACGGDDCDDNDPNRYPGNVEVCDHHDEDCDPTTLGPDNDHDGFVSTACCNPDATGMLVCGTDCDDTRMTVHPGAVEACNGVDDDCDGVIDNGVQLTFYRDIDGDGYGQLCVHGRRLQRHGTCGPSRRDGDLRHDRQRLRRRGRSGLHVHLRAHATVRTERRHGRVCFARHLRRRHADVQQRHVVRVRWRRHRASGDVQHDGRRLQRGRRQRRERHLLHR